MAQPFLAAVAETCASLSFCAHSSQQTSTVLPPIWTLTAFASSLQSQAAQVFSIMTSSPIPEVRVRSECHAAAENRCQIL
jgi:hypothetical protein